MLPATYFDITAHWIQTAVNLQKESLEETKRHNQRMEELLQQLVNTKGGNE